MGDYIREVDAIPRLLHIVPAFTYGVASFVKNLVDASDEKVIIDVLGVGSIPENFNKVITSKKGECIRITSVHSSPINMLKETLNAMNNHKYLAVHCHVYGYKGYVYKLLAKVCGIKNIFMHAHSAGNESKSKLGLIHTITERFFSRALSNYYIACSSLAAAGTYGANFCKTNNIILLPNAVNTDAYCLDYSQNKINDLKGKLSIEKDTYIVGHIGRFYPPKNHAFMINIIRELNKDIKHNWCMIFVGDGNLEEEIKHKAVAEGVAENIRFLGPRDDVPDILQIMDVFILPSYFEGLPVVAIEAQAAGIPIIMSTEVTKEADMEMGIVRYLPLTADIKEWCINISDLFICKQKVKGEKRREILRGKGFSKDILWEQYKTLLQNLDV